MMPAVEIEGGFAKTGPGLWLAGCGQPTAFRGSVSRKARRGWRVRDRALLKLVQTEGKAWFAMSSRPFLTHIPCAADVYAVSGKVLVAPAAARKDAVCVKPVPMSFSNSVCATLFGQPENGGAGEKNREAEVSSWVVMATQGRTTRISLEEGEMLSARPESVVAWTGRKPTGYCPKLSIWNIILPRPPRDLLFTFYGPGIVWIEGSADQRLATRIARPAGRAIYGV
jgi:hypothetical protein